jgi:tetratricopeptide (TPR) repeat protein
MKANQMEEKNSGKMDFESLQKAQDIYLLHDIPSAINISKKSVEWHYLNGYLEGGLCCEYYLAQAYEKDGQVKEAIKIYQRLLDLCPTTPRLREYEATCKEKIKTLAS